MGRCLEVLEVGDSHEDVGVDADREAISISTLGERQGDEFAEISEEKRSHRIGVKGSTEREKDSDWVRRGANETPCDGLGG